MMARRPGIRGNGRASVRFDGLTSSIAQAAACWLVAFALIFQTALSPLVGLSVAGPVAAAEICHSDQAPSDSDSKHRTAADFKCIACVLACSLAPPALSAYAPPELAWRLQAKASPLSQAAPRSAPRSSHSARGPPAIA